MFDILTTEDTIHPTITSTESHAVYTSRVAPLYQMSSAGRARPTVQKLMAYIEPASPDTTNERIFERFSENPALRMIPFVVRGIPVGLVNRYDFIDRFAKPYQRVLLGKMSCDTSILAEPLLVNKDMPIEELSHYIAEANAHHFSDGFVITDQGQYLGVATGHDLLRELTKMQIEAARYANPLTLLPGNAPVNEHIERFLYSATSFVICHCNLDNFRFFNDEYGYLKGNALIQMTGRILGIACDPKLDFIGHIGGDDFILLMRSRDWRKRCNEALLSFDRLSVSLVSEVHRSAGGFERAGRQGIIAFHSLPTLSIGAVRIPPNRLRLPCAVLAAATDANKLAKRTQGSSLFVEQRSFP